ncbi:glycosyltransferase family 2 protein [Clostridium sp. C1]|uniref:glycosyltransferase family 2 protein n=1 Tax=Clostridium sp. C1 TaxID=1155388 RepID=UPI001BAA8C7C|nr:glycosyltransferase family 2 protein [Clostridium sp. C1]QUN12909.1 glycosyltransferase family 2 protein [Clostridium sp. C1]
MNPKINNINISFIVPAFNCEKYLYDCVDSIVKQKLKSIEIIIINDGSTDNTLKIAEMTQEKYPSIIRVFSKKNGGAASARNYGLKKSIGKYVIFIDSDDLIFGNSLNKCIEIMEQKNIDIFLSDISLLVNDKVKRNEHNSRNILISSNVLEYISYLPKFPGSCCSKIFSREYLNKYSLYFIEGIVNEDIDYMINCFTNNPIIYHSNISWYLYRQNVVNSVTHTVHSRNCFDMFEVIEKNLNLTTNIKEINRILCYEYTTLFYYYNRLKKDDKKSLKRYFKKYRYLLLHRGKKEKIIYVLYFVLGLDISSCIISDLYKIKRGSW